MIGLSRCVMVAHQILALLVRVRILPGQQKLKGGVVRNTPPF